MSRPARDFDSGPVTRAVRISAFVIALATSAMLLVKFPQLPHEIPIHFNLAGEADGWGSRNSVFVLIGIFTVLSAAMTWLSFRPQIFNYPVLINEPNAQASYREAERMFVWMSLILSLMYVATAVCVVFNRDPGLMLILGLVSFVIVIGFGTIRVLRAASMRSTN